MYIQYNAHFYKFDMFCVRLWVILTKNENTSYKFLLFYSSLIQLKFKMLHPAAWLEILELDRWLKAIFNSILNGTQPRLWQVFSSSMLCSNLHFNKASLSLFREGRSEVPEVLTFCFE